jgi:pyruvate-ferredoxin/flavodoxin oxidoreductase
LVEFSPACAGCGETPYAKLITQLYGDRMLVANTAGCVAVWGGVSPAISYTKNIKGHGPAWGYSLFEDNAEYGYGLFLGSRVVRQSLADKARDYLAGKNPPAPLAEALKAWLEGFNDRKALGRGPKSWKRF